MAIDKKPVSFRSKLGLRESEEVVKAVEKKDDEEVKEEDEMDAEEEKPVEEAEDSEEEKVADVTEDDETEMSDEEKPVEEAEDSEEEKEEEVSEDEQEFDINDESDVFLDDSEEAAAEDAVEPEEKKEEEETEEEPVEEEEEEPKEKKDEPKLPDMDVEEDVNALFNGEELSEDFKKKARLVLESAVRRKVLQLAKNLKTRYNKKLNKAKMAITERVVEKVDSYMDYVVENWMEENKLAIQSGLRTEITEEFIGDLRKLFESHNIMVPEGKENLLESQAAVIEQLKKEREDVVRKNISLRKQLNEQKRIAILSEVCEGLTDTEIEKFRAIAASVNYDDSYRDKLNVLKENYYSSKIKKAKPVDTLNESDDTKETEKPSGLMDVYVKTLSKLR